MSTWDPEEPGVLCLPGGRLVRGRRWSAPPGQEPEWGLYALWRRPAPPWPHAWVRWPDFGLPLDPRQARDAVETAWELSAHARVEVACGGGRGRTGTVLAALACGDGLEPDAAIRWVRQHYDHRAVETPWQRRWVERWG